MTLAIILAAALSSQIATPASADCGVKYRGIFVNDEDWGLRPWAVKHFGKKEQIGVRAYKEIFSLMKRDGLNLVWPAMHEGGYEFSSRPENFDMADKYGITVGTSHCEPMLRNNCYLSREDKKKWSWVGNREFLEEYWREGVRRGSSFAKATEDGRGAGVLWTIGMRGIHDGKLQDGKTTEEKIKIFEEVFAAQCAMLPEGAPRLFVPYKEVLPIFNAGLKVPEGTTIMWTNDNFGYVRRVGGPQCEGYGGGKRQPTPHNRWSSQMQWPWNEPSDPYATKDRGVARADYPATAYRADIAEPEWLDPAMNEPANGGAWTRVEGLGTSGRALALLPVKPGVGKGAAVEYFIGLRTSDDGLRNNAEVQSPKSGVLVIQFLPDFALWPGLKLGVEVSFDDGAAKYVAVPKSDANIGEHDPVRNRAVQDNFIRVEVPVPTGAKRVRIAAADPGVVIDRVGIRAETARFTKLGLTFEMPERFDRDDWEGLGPLTGVPGKSKVNAFGNWAMHKDDYRFLGNRGEVKWVGAGGNRDKDMWVLESGTGNVSFENVGGKIHLTENMAVAGYGGKASGPSGLKSPKDINMKGSFKVYNASPEPIDADVVPDLTFTHHYGF